MLQARSALTGWAFAESDGFAWADPLFGLLSLGLMFLAFRYQPGFGPLAVAYPAGIAQTPFPSHPIGLGVIEVTLVDITVGFGGPRATAVIAGPASGIAGRSYRLAAPPMTPREDSYSDPAGDEAQGSQDIVDLQRDIVGVGTGLPGGCGWSCAGGYRGLPGCSGVPFEGAAVMITGLGRAGGWFSVSVRLAAREWPGSVRRVIGHPASGRPGGGGNR